jgi:hypothetical protein
MNHIGILISLGLIILLILLATIFRKIIALTTVRMLFGKFSFEFYHLYKKYYVRSPHQYCFRDEFISHLLFVISKKNELPSYSSIKDIYFENTPYFINYKELLKKKGAPYCFNAFAFSEPDFVIKALGYQTIISGNKAVLVFYFMNDSFFMGEYIFKNPKNNIRASLMAYFIEEGDISADNFYIENSKNRIIHYQDTGFTIDIKYLTREDQTIINTLSQYYTRVTGKKSKVNVNG